MDQNGKESTIGEGVSRALSPEIIRKDFAIEGHLILSQKLNDGWVPITALVETRSLQTHFKKHYKPQKFDLGNMCRVLSESFQDDPALVSGVLLDAEKGLFKLETDICIRDAPCHARTCSMLFDTVDVGRGRTYAATLIPADAREPVQEVQLEGGTWYLQQVSKCLGIEVGDVLCWGRAGKKFRAFRFPDDPASHTTYANKAIRDVLLKYITDADLERLAQTAPKVAERLGYSAALPPAVAGSNLPGQVNEDVSSEALADKSASKIAEGKAEKCPVGSASPSGTGSATSAGVETEKVTEAADGSGYGEIPMEDVLCPYMYGTYRSTGQPLNLRASWLVGAEVHGPLLLSNVFMRASEIRNPVVKWDHFSVHDFWRWLPSSSPFMEFWRDSYNVSIPLFLCFPDFHSQRNPSAIGTVTKFIVGPGRTSEPSVQEMWDTTEEDIESSQDSTFTCTVSVPFLGDTVPHVEESTPCKTREAAQQEAYLLLLKEFQRRWRQLFYQDSLLELPLSGWTVEVESWGETSAVMPQPGATVHVQYKVTCLDNMVLQSSPSRTLMKIPWGPGFPCIAPIKDVLQEVRVGGSATIKARMPIIPLPMAGPETCMKDVQIHVKVVKVANAVLPSSGVASFVPCLAQQRYSFIVQTLQQHKCRVVADVGCGEGRLLEYLISQGFLAESLYGLDVSKSGLQRAARKLGSRGPPSCHLINISAFTEEAAAGGWQGMGSCDAVILTEVVEHLDPMPLSNVFKVVLGTVRPQVVIITTPNVEYNTVLVGAGVPLQEGMFRNSDHRFEWTRKDFEAWVMKGIESYPAYSASFHGIGKTVNHELDLMKLGQKGGQDVGCCCQAAVLLRQAGVNGKEDGRTKGLAGTKRTSEVALLTATAIQVDAVQ
eukprot:jgi/Botrbrau1/6635/Bobra.104_2s0022.1